MGFPWQEYWVGLPSSSPGDIPNPGIKPRSPSLQADSLPSETPGNPLNDYNTVAKTDSMWTLERGEQLS